MKDELERKRMRRKNKADLMKLPIGLKLRRQTAKRKHSVTANCYVGIFARRRRPKITSTK